MHFCLIENLPPKAYAVCLDNSSGAIRNAFVCGRYTLSVERKALEDHFKQNISEYTPRFNIAPSQSLPVVREIPGQLSFMKWGLIPSWSKDPKQTGFINARSDGVAVKPSFRSAYKKRRCLIPASGFFEWTKQGTKKIPHYIFLKSSPLFAFAGLWEVWKSPEGELIETFTIITCDANEMMKSLHDRMPVILKPSDYLQWLNLSIDPQDLLEPYPSSEMSSYIVSTLVNSPKNENPDLLKPVSA